MAGCRMGRWSPTWRASSASCAEWAGTGSEWPSCGQRLLRRTTTEIAMSGSYFDDVLRDPPRCAIENITDKVRRPGLFDQDATPCAPSVLSAMRKQSTGTCSRLWSDWRPPRHYGQIDPALSACVEKSSVRNSGDRISKYSAVTRVLSKTKPHIHGFPRFAEEWRPNESSDTSGLLFPKCLSVRVVEDAGAASFTSTVACSVSACTSRAR